MSNVTRCPTMFVTPEAARSGVVDKQCGLEIGHAGLCSCPQGLGGGPVQQTDDKVEHPPHYNQHPSGVECIAITEHMSFNVGNAIKYLWRAGLKDGTPTDDDLRKAIWYIERERQRLFKSQSK